MECGIRQAFSDRHILSLQSCIDTADERRVEEDHDKVTREIKCNEYTIEEYGSTGDSGLHKFRQDQRQYEGRKHDERHNAGEDRKHEEFFIIHKNVPARFDERKTPANAFKHTIGLGREMR